MENPEHEYIGRSGIVFINKKRFPTKSSPYANPFKVKTVGLVKCLELYELWLRQKINDEGIEEITKLKNKVLGCWCKPNMCHGDILIKILNEIEE